MNSGKPTSFAEFFTLVGRFSKGADRGVRYLRVLVVGLFLIGSFLLFTGGLSGSLVSAGSGAVGLTAAAWSIRQMYFVWKDGRFLETLKSLEGYVNLLPEAERAAFIKRIAELLLEWVKIEEPLPSVKT